MSYCLSVGLKGGNGKEKLRETGPNRLHWRTNGAQNRSLKLTENHHYKNMCEWSQTANYITSFRNLKHGLCQTLASLLRLFEVITSDHNILNILKSAFYHCLNNF